MCWMLDNSFDKLVLSLKQSINKYHSNNEEETLNSKNKYK